MKIIKTKKRKFDCHKKKTQQKNQHNELNILQTDQHILNLAMWTLNFCRCILAILNKLYVQVIFFFTIYVSDFKYIKYFLNILSFWFKRMLQILK